LVVSFNYLWLFKIFRPSFYGMITEFIAQHFKFTFVIFVINKKLVLSIKCCRFFHLVCFFIGCLIWSVWVDFTIYIKLILIICLFKPRIGVFIIFVCFFYFIKPFLAYIFLKRKLTFFKLMIIKLIRIFQLLAVNLQFLPFI